VEAKHGRIMVGEEKFRSVMGCFATGVTVAASRNPADVQNPLFFFRGSVKGPNP
jgi:hypothetical protein